MKYTQNYNLRKPEDTDPADIQDLNYNADTIDAKLKELEDWQDTHQQAQNPHQITPEMIGAETTEGAQQKANQAETNAKSYADIVANSTLNSAKDYADGVLESANSHTDQVASDLSQKLNETRIKVLDVEQDVSNISKVLINLNPNQEAKQSVSGYGILYLPKNAANGQVSATVKGNTETDEEGNGKSTFGALRIRSVSEDETQESSAYVIATDADTGEILELRSLPNGTKDEVRLSDGKMVKRVSDEIMITGEMLTGITRQYSDTYDRLDFDGVNLINAVEFSSTSIDTRSNLYGYTITVSSALAWTSNSYYITSAGKVRIIVNKNTFASITEAKNYFNANPATLIYQLAEPVEIPVQVSGNLISYPNGTIYIERIIPDAGIYTDKITILHQDAPIKRLDKLSKVDFMTGVETELDISQAEIAEDKLSFTHPDLSEGDIVFFEYEYDVESTEGEAEVEFYDSRYVVKDDVTGKFYKWNVKVSNGTPTIEVVEV